MLKAISLFSGCGGSDLGATRAGIDIVLANDNYAPAAQTYKRFKSLLASDAVDFRDSDVREIRAFPSCELLLGCYPCQSFSMGGPRNPESDPRTKLYREFRRCLNATNPRYFVAENVAGMKWLESGQYLEAQLRSFKDAGNGYRASVAMLNAKDYGVPADRKRIFIVGVRKDLHAWYHFPPPTHGPNSEGEVPYESHGKALVHLPVEADGEYYNQGTEPFSWWYMSRNRKRPWREPSHTIVANWRHLPLHPASPKMRLVESDLAKKSFQRWEFTRSYDAPKDQAKLPEPRRLSWRECAALQTFPPEFEPHGTIEQKCLQIGNAVPPLLMQRIVEGLVTKACLFDERPPYGVGVRIPRELAL
jgi:DNA (cytosine-5)-methyltransferase 1